MASWPDSLHSYSPEFPPVFAFTMSVSPVKLNFVYLCVSLLDRASRRKVAMSLGSDVFYRFLPLSLHLSGIEFPVRGSFFLMQSIDVK